MHVTVVVVTYQSAGMLGACIESARGLDDVSVRVVDNASTDASCAIARSLGAEVVALSRNTGFAAAATRGAEGVATGLLCFLNPDCELTAGAVQAAREALGSGRLACCVPEFEQGGDVVRGRQPGYTWRKVLADVTEGNHRLRSVTRWLRRHPRHDDHGWRDACDARGTDRSHRRRTRRPHAGSTDPETPCACRRPRARGDP